MLVDKVEGTDCLFLPAMHEAENDIAQTLVERAWQPPPWRIKKIEDTVKSAEAALGLELAEEQREALRLAYESRLLIITGGPGTGKTTLVKAILKGLEKNQIDVMLAAPTGRAARRLGESAEQEAKTLHRLLEAEPGKGFRRDANRPLSGDLLIVDEMSMVDIPLMQALCNALPEGAALFLVGDVDQLPSIGPGQVLLDLILSGKLPVIRLEKIFRQAAESKIIQNAHRINKGEMPDTSRVSDADLVDFYAIKAGTPERAAETLVELVAKRIPERFGVDAVSDVQILCPTNRGPIGTRTLNEKLQAVLNPNALDRVEQRGIAYATGDKVMQIENDYEREIYNGDIGRLTQIDRGQSNSPSPSTAAISSTASMNSTASSPPTPSPCIRPRVRNTPSSSFRSPASKVACSGVTWSIRRLPGRSAWSSCSQNQELWKQRSNNVRKRDAGRGFEIYCRVRRRPGGPPPFN